MNSIKKFNAHRDIRIDRVKAHHTYLKPKKVKGQARDDTDWEGDWQGNLRAPWELSHVKGLQAGKPKKKLDRERIFDTKDDGKSLPKIKETKKEKLSRAFVMMDSKKYHQIDDGRFVAAGL